MTRQQYAHTDPLRLWWIWGSRFIWLVFLSLLLALIGTSWLAPEHFPIAFFAVLATPLVVLLYKREALNLLAVLTTFVVIAGYEAGLQVEEVLYGVYFLSFLVAWYLARLVRDERVFTSAEDWALFLFLTYAATSSTWALLFGASTTDILGEGIILAMFALYFPVKAACQNDERFLKWLWYLLIWFGLFATIRNLMIYREALSSATYLWQIVRGRVALNEMMVMVPALASLCLLIFARRRYDRIVLSVLCCTFIVALILTQSRGYWASYLLGVVAMMILVDRKKRVEIVMLSAGTTVAFVLVGLFLFPDAFTLIWAGVVERVGTLGTAFFSDLSLVNRIHESNGLWNYIKPNPVIGYGIGAPFQYFNIIEDLTYHQSYTHNALLGLWFKFGLVGLVLMLYFWFKGIRNAVRLFKLPNVSHLSHMAGLIAAVVFVAEVLVSNTSSPFLIADACLLIAILAGASNGSLARLTASGGSKRFT